MTVKEKILSLVEASTAGIAYSAITNNIDLRGPCLLSHANYPFVRYWQGLSEPAAQAILELTNEGVLRHEPTDTLAYIAHGETLDLPVFTIEQVADASTLAEPHWMPVLLIRAV